MGGGSGAWSDAGGLGRQAQQFQGGQDLARTEGGQSAASSFGIGGGMTSIAEKERPSRRESLTFEDLRRHSADADILRKSVGLRGGGGGNSRGGGIGDASMGVSSANMSISIEDFESNLSAAFEDSVVIGQSEGDGSGSEGRNPPLSHGKRSGRAIKEEAGPNGRGDSGGDDVETPSRVVEGSVLQEKGACITASGRSRSANAIGALSLQNQKQLGGSFSNNALSSSSMTLGTIGDMSVATDMLGDSTMGTSNMGMSYRFGEEEE